MEPKLETSSEAPNPVAAVTLSTEHSEANKPIVGQEEKVAVKIEEREEAKLHEDNKQLEEVLQITKEPEHGPVAPAPEASHGDTNAVLVSLPEKKGSEVPETATQAVQLDTTNEQMAVELKVSDDVSSKEPPKPKYDILDTLYPQEPRISMQEAKQKFQQEDTTAKPKPTGKQIMGEPVQVKGNSLFVQQQREKLLGASPEAKAETLDQDSHQISD